VRYLHRDLDRLRSLSGGREDARGGTTMTEQHTPAQADGGEGLIRQVLEARTRLGPAATPEAVVDDLHGRGLATVTVDEVRDVWDEGHLPA